MAQLLHFGRDQSAPIEPRAGGVVYVCDAPRGEGLADVAAATGAALAAPLEFPPLTDSVFPGDKVAIVLDEGIPEWETITATVIETLRSAGVAASDVVVLRPASTGAGTHAAEPNQPESISGVKLVVHDPTDRSGLAYLAATRAGRPIYVNRHLDEADLVIPIGVMRLDEHRHCGPAGWGLFPLFSDAETMGRYRSAAFLESAEKRRKLDAEADEAHWQLGAPFAVGVVPGAAGGALAVIAGEAAAIARRGAEVATAAWDCAAPERAELVLAAVNGPESEQTWENVGRAIAAALAVVTDDGAILIATELAEPPGPALQQIAGAEEPREARSRIAKEAPVDAAAAARLIAALEHGRVYFASRLDQATIEELGMIPVSDPGEITRLASRHATCAILANAQYIVPRVGTEKLGEGASAAITAPRSARRRKSKSE